MGESPQSNERRPIEVALQLARSDFVAETHRSLEEAGVVEAVACHDTPAIFDWVVGMLPLQGISDAAAMRFQHEHGRITWADVEAGLSKNGRCPSLRSWWHFRCGFRKTAWTCSHPDLLETCAVPGHDLRKGVLNEGAYGFFLFLRDVCDGDLIAWIDRRLSESDSEADPVRRGRLMSAALVQPLTEVSGTGPKLWSMILADLLLAADPDRKLWVTAGAAMVAVDTLVHGWLHRTGTMERYGVEHPYGPRCYAIDGCADVIEQLARTIDARIFNAHFPRYFPRFVQVAIWEFCAEGVRNVCNGRQIDDRYDCRQMFCPAGASCARKPLKMV